MKAWLAAQEGAENVGCVLLNWAIYGSSWLVNHSKGLVIERFERRANQHFGPNHHYKSIVRTAAFESLSSNPHHFHLKPGWRHTLADGTDLIAHAAHGAGLSQEVVWKPFRLNHYAVKSRQEFDSRKAVNGSAASLNRVKGEAYFKGLDRNDVRDPISTDFTKRVRQEMDRIEGQLSAEGYDVPRRCAETPRYAPPFSRAHGHVDRVDRQGTALHFHGWAIKPSGEAIEKFSITVDGQPREVRISKGKARPDVQRHYPGASPMSGFHLIAEISEIELEASEIEVVATDSENTTLFRLALPQSHNGMKAHL